MNKKDTSGARSTWPNGNVVNHMESSTSSSSLTSKKRRTSIGVLDASLSQSRQALLHHSNDDSTPNDSSSSHNDLSSREGSATTNVTRLAKEPSVTRIRLRGRDLYSSRLRFGGSLNTTPFTSTAQALRSSNRLLLNSKSSMSAPYSLQNSARNRRRAGTKDEHASNDTSALYRSGNAALNSGNSSQSWTSYNNTQESEDKREEGRQQDQQQAMSATAKVILETLQKMNDENSLKDNTTQEMLSEPILMSRAEKRRRLAQELLAAASSSTSVSLSSSSLQLPSSSSSFLQGPPLRTAFSISAGSPVGVRLKRRAPRTSTTSSMTETGKGSEIVLAKPSTSSSTPSSTVTDDGNMKKQPPHASSSAPFSSSLGQTTTTETSYFSSLSSSKTATKNEGTDKEYDRKDENSVSKNVGGKIRSRLGERGKAREDAKLIEQGPDHEHSRKFESLANAESKSFFSGIKSLPTFNFDHAEVLSGIKKPDINFSRKKVAEESVGLNQSILTSKQLNASPPTSEGQEDNLQSDLQLATKNKNEKKQEVPNTDLTKEIKEDEKSNLAPSRQSSQENIASQVFRFCNGQEMQTLSGKEDPSLKTDSGFTLGDSNFNFSEAQVIKCSQPKPSFKTKIVEEDKDGNARPNDEPAFIFGNASSITAMMGQQPKPLKQGSVMDILGKSKLEKL